MSYFRVRYDGYIEDEFEDGDEAADAFLTHMESLEAPDLIVEEFNEATGEWEWQ